MAPHAALSRIAKTIGRELRSGQGPSDAAQAAVAMLADADVVLAIAAGMFAEGRRKRPDQRSIAGYAFMLESALAELRMAGNGGDTGAVRRLAEVREGLGQQVAAGGTDPTLLLMVARAFAQAGLDPGPALQQAMVSATEAQAELLGDTPSPAEIGGQFVKLAAALGDDPFAVFAELSASGAAFPPPHRAAMAALLAQSESQPVREAALGFALERDPASSAAALAALARPAAGRPVSSATIERLVRIRPWLSPTRREGVDAAIRALRPLAAAPVAGVGAEIRAVLASPCDGAGAQSLFGLVKRGRRYAMACFLVKADFGIADAWTQGDLSKSEADAMSGQIAGAAEAMTVTLDFLQRRIADALAVNVVHDAPPPFGLLQCIEALGLGPIMPQAVSSAELAESLLAGLPVGLTDAAATLAAHRASAGWSRDFAAIASWYEAGEAVEALLRPFKGRKQRIEAVKTKLLPKRRGFWAASCGWMAATLKARDLAGDQSWISFALVARDLASEAPLAGIPLAERIAGDTVEAFAQR